MLAGAFVLAAATGTTRFAAGATSDVWFMGAAFAPVALALALAIEAMRRVRRLRPRGHEIFLAESGVSLRHAGAQEEPQAFELTEASMAWPAFAVLSLRPLPSRPLPRAEAGRRPLSIAVVRAELQADQAWGLHRYLRWAERGGTRATGSTKEPLG